MDKYEALMNIYNDNCEGYVITTKDIEDKDEDDDGISISGTLSKLFKTYIYVCSYYPNGDGEANVDIKVMEKGKSWVVDKTIEVEDTIEI